MAMLAVAAKLFHTPALSGLSTLPQAHAQLGQLVGGTAALAFAIVGCERPGTIDHPTVSGRRVQATDVVARAAPLRVRAYELRFSDASEADVQARRAALVVEFAGSDGHARGFVEWGKAG